MDPFVRMLSWALALLAASNAWDIDLSSMMPPRTTCWPVREAVSLSGWIEPVCPRPTLSKAECVGAVWLCMFCEFLLPRANAANRLRGQDDEALLCECEGENVPLRTRRRTTRFVLSMSVRARRLREPTHCHST